MALAMHAMSAVCRVAVVAGIEHMLSGHALFLARAPYVCACTYLPNNPAIPFTPPRAAGLPVPGQRLHSG